MQPKLLQIESNKNETTCVYCLGRIPSSIITKKLKETSKAEEMEESEEET